ncbi:MAG: hypothetical protein ACPL25_03355 [Ignavibacteria bacterium]
MNRKVITSLQIRNRTELIKKNEINWKRNYEDIGKYYWKLKTDYKDGEIIEL